jgi:hypothetical protein
MLYRQLQTRVPPISWNIDAHAEGLRRDLCTNASVKSFGTFVQDLSWGVGGLRGCREV